MPDYDLKAYVQSRQNQFIQDLEALVSIDSCSDDPEGIERVAAYLSPRLEALGLQTSLLHLGADRVPCLQALSPGHERFGLLLVGHMDTVFPKGEVAKRPFAVRDGMAYGPGVSDMKAGLLVALHSLEALKHCGLLERMAVRVAFNGDEETGSHDSQAWIEESARTCSRAFIFEPCRPDYGLVLARKGGGAYRLTCLGKAAHAGAALDQGANALLEMAQRVLDIHAQTDLEKGTTVTPTVLHSGDKDNVVPDRAEAAVDVRFTEPAEMERVVGYFKELPGLVDDPRVSLRVEGGMEKPAMNPSAESLKIWRLFKRCGLELGLDLKQIHTGGCSDGNYTAAQGIPTIDGLGGMGNHAHTDQEYVDLASIAPMVQLVARVCIELGENTG